MAIGRFFSTTFTKQQLMPADVACVANIPIRLAEFVVPLGKVFAWGRGLDLGLTDTEGRIFLDMRGTGAAPGAIVDGTVRLVAINQLGQEQEIYWEGRTEQLRLGATILRDRMILPNQEPLVPNGFSLAVVFISDTTVTVGQANTTILIDGRRARRLGA